MSKKGSYTTVEYDNGCKASGKVVESKPGAFDSPLSGGDRWTTVETKDGTRVTGREYGNK